MKSLANSIFVLLALAANPVSAADRMVSPSGPVRIVTAVDGTLAVAVGSQILPLESAVTYADLDRRLGNLVLLSVSFGGNACPASWHWLDTTPGKVRLTEGFGTCSDLVEVSHDSETVTVTMPSLDPSAGRVAFVYDGRTIIERPLGLAPVATASAAEGNPDAWIGQSPLTYLTAPELEPQLTALMGWVTLKRLRNAMVVGEQSMKAEGDWIVGSGCMAHNCGYVFGAIAIHRGDGTFIAALKLEDQAPTLIGTPPASLPVAIRKVMTAG